MINKIKDKLGFKRRFTLSVYSFGYMGNQCHFLDFEVFNSLNYLESVNLNSIAASKIKCGTFIAPRIATVIKQDKG
jgi:hypothetical protein